MKKIAAILVPLLIAASGALFAGCSVIPRSESALLYDLGPLRAQQNGAALPALPPISVADASSPAWLDNTMMFFRLNYANEQQPRPYAHARWSMTPAQLLSQRLKSRIVQSGGVALSASDGATGVPVLRIEVDDFTQNFDSPGQSSARVALRASAFKGRALIAQKSFVEQASTPSADAAGGAKALSDASDAAISRLIAWLATLDLT